MLAMRSTFSGAAFRGVGARAVGVRPLVAPAVRPMEQSSFLGGTSMLAPSLVQAPGRSAMVCKAGMACTISGKGSNKKRRTTSGYRKRKQSPAGVKVLKARMKKGRKVLAPASQKKSGGKK